MYINLETQDSTSIYGERINVDISKIEFDTFLEIPNGKLGISNTNSSKKNVDTIAPIIVKFDKSKKVIWAEKLNSKEMGITFYELSNIELIKDNGNKIRFFNPSYSEPGVIYLTESFDIDYFYLYAF